MSVRLVSLLALVLLVACDQNSQRLNPGEPLPPAPVGLRTQLGMPSTAGTGRTKTPASSPGTPAETPGMGEAGAGETAQAEAITGTVRLSPELESKVSESAAVYMIAYKPSGPPVAAARFDATFPLQFRIGKENMMFQGAEFAGSFDLVARLSQKGTASGAEAGDIEGNPANNPVAVGSSAIEIVLDTVVP